MSLPDPSQLLFQAEEESARFNIEDYWQTILVLRQKHFSWRQISDWFAKEGLNVDHTKIFRFAQRCQAIQLGLVPEDEQLFVSSDFLREAVTELVGLGNVPALTEDAEMAQPAVAEYEVTDFEVSSREGIVMRVQFVVRDLRDISDNPSQFAGKAVAVLAPDNHFAFREVEAPVSGGFIA